LDSLKKTLNAKTAAVQGSGWGWLVYNEPAGKLEIITLKDQDPVIGGFLHPFLESDRF
jgi:Fe-Mn family superoxide dismutase